jgi:hypothetical protein
MRAGSRVALACPQASPVATRTARIASAAQGRAAAFHAADVVEREARGRSSGSPRRAGAVPHDAPPALYENLEPRDIARGCPARRCGIVSAWPRSCSANVSNVISATRVASALRPRPAARSAFPVPTGTAYAPNGGSVGRAVDRAACPTGILRTERLGGGLVVEDLSGGGGSLGGERLGADVDTQHLERR